MEVLLGTGTSASSSSLSLPGYEVNSLLPTMEHTHPRGSKQCEHLILDWNLQKYEFITCFSSKLILSVVLIAVNSLLIQTVILGEVFRNGHTLTHRYSSPAFYVLCHFAFLRILLSSAQATF